MKTLDLTDGRGPYPGDEKMREEQAAKHRKSMDKYYAQQAADREELTQLRAENERLQTELVRLRSAFADSEHRNVLLHREMERIDGEV